MLALCWLFINIQSVSAEAADFSWPFVSQLVFQDVATPLTNVHYLGSQRGAMYSSEHNLERFYAEAVARNRCSTPVKNLYISGRKLQPQGDAAGAEISQTGESWDLLIKILSYIMLKRCFKQKPLSCHFWYDTRSQSFKEQADPAEDSDRAD